MKSVFPCIPEVTNRKEASGSDIFDGLSLLGSLWVKSQAVRKRHEAAVECT